MTVRRLTELTWSGVTDAEGAIAVVPIGSQEQHAGHLPMGTDTLLVEAVLDEALAAFTDDGPLLVRLPALPYGHSPHHLFRAAVSLSAETLLRVLGEVLDSLHTSGFGRVLIVNGHGGNAEVMALAVKQFALRAPVAAAACSYWQTEPADDVRRPGHAGWFETSLMLAAHPALVRPPAWDGPAVPPPLFDRPVHPGLLVERGGEWPRVGGITDDPTAADGATGRDLLHRCGRGLAGAIDAFDQATTTRSHQQ
jgi:creatinine amidohydrolase